MTFGYIWIIQNGHKHNARQNFVHQQRWLLNVVELSRIAWLDSLSFVFIFKKRLYLKNEGHIGSSKIHKSNLLRYTFPGTNVSLVRHVIDMLVPWRDYGVDDHPLIDY